MPHLKQIVGLDIGARHARAVWVQLRNGAPHIVRAEQMALPLEGGDAPALLRSWLGQLGLLKKFAAVQIPGTQLVFQPGRLNPDDRAVITLVELEERSMEDAARRLGCGLSAVKVRAFRARRRLKAILEDLRPGKEEKP